MALACDRLHGIGPVPEFPEFPEFPGFPRD